MVGGWEGGGLIRSRSRKLDEVVGLAEGLEVGWDGGLIVMGTGGRGMLDSTPLNENPGPRASWLPNSAGGIRS